MQKSYYLVLNFVFLKILTSKGVIKLIIKIDDINDNSKDIKLSNIVKIMISIE